MIEVVFIAFAMAISGAMVKMEYDDKMKWMAEAVSCQESFVSDCLAKSGYSSEECPYEDEDGTVRLRPCEGRIEDGTGEYAQP